VGLAIAGGALYTRRHQLAAPAARHGLPTIYPDFDANFALSVGLMSSGTAVPEGIEVAAGVAG
jgi:hypothetical protein